MFVWRPWLAFDLADNPARDFGQVLYVGLAGTLRDGDSNKSTLKQRYKHYRQFLAAEPEELWSSNEPVTREQRLGRYLTLRPLEYWCLVIKDVHNLLNLETRLIATLNPPCNTKDTPILVVPGVEVPAWTRR